MSRRITAPLVVEEVEISTSHPSRIYIVRREPHPDDQRVWITQVIRDDVKIGPGYGDIHTRRAIETLDDDGGPLDQLAQEWADAHGIGRPLPT